jgi:hypothetical protein
VVKFFSHPERSPEFPSRAMRAPDAGEMTKTSQAHLAMFKQHRAIRV